LINYHLIKKTKAREGNGWEKINSQGTSFFFLMRRNATINVFNNQRELFDEISKKLKIVDWKDWYKVHLSDVVNQGGRELLFKRYGGIFIVMIDIADFSSRIKIE
jgi:hypothetical protein